MLNLIKAVKELDSIDLDQLLMKIQLLKEIEGEQRQEEAVPPTPNPEPALAA